MELQIVVPGGEAMSGALGDTSTLAHRRHIKVDRDRLSPRSAALLDSKGRPRPVRLEELCEEDASQLPARLGALLRSLPELPEHGAARVRTPVEARSSGVRSSRTEQAAGARSMERKRELGGTHALR